MVTTNCLRLICIAGWFASVTWSFVTPSIGSQLMRQQFTVATALQAKKKKGGSKPQGFGKAPPVEEKPPKQSPASTSSFASGQGGDSSNFLTSVQGGSDAIPTIDTTPQKKKAIDESIPVEERTSKILREQYGMRTLEEQQAEFRRNEQIKEQRKKLDEWKKLADQGEDFDIMKILPGPVLKGIDTFLKLGLGITGVLFILAGLGITAEAWSKTSNNPLPENIDTFIVDIIEPNFTTGLLVLLGFSVSLGLFASAQLSSASSTYKEK